MTSSSGGDVSQRETRSWRYAPANSTLIRAGFMQDLSRTKQVILAEKT
jgi:hypothetical protein